MEKRTFKRIPANLTLKVPFYIVLHSGTLTNLSANGMLIKADICFPIKSIFEVLVQLKDEILKITVEVVRIIKSGDFYEGIGVQIVNQSKDYLELLIKLNFNSIS